jgi:hypothetical protein
LIGHEVELLGKVAKHEVLDDGAIGLVARHACENGKQEQEEREQGQQRVVRDRGGEGQIVAVVDAGDPTPDGERGEPHLAAGSLERAI